MLRSQNAAGGEVGAAVQTSAPDDVRLLDRVAARDPHAFEALYRLYHPRLTRFAANMVRKPELVEEIVNDTLLAVWRRPEGYNGGSKVSTWIFAIAYRKTLKAFRRLDEPVEDVHAEHRPSLEPGPDRQLGQSQVRAALLQAMDELSVEHRAVVDLTYFQDLGYKEIAEIMGCPTDTVRTRMFHARRRLKSFMAGRLEDWL
jgi:RNA polymerase sigma factor (sigma-70 family)